MIIQVFKNNKIIKTIKFGAELDGIELIAYVGDLCDEFFGDLFYKKEIKENNGTWFMMDEKNKLYVGKG